MPELDSLFEEQYALDEAGSRWALHELTRRSTLLSVVHAPGGPERLSRVFGRPGPNPSRLLLDHPADDAPLSPALKQDEVLHLYWLDHGVHFAAQVRVMRVHAKLDGDGGVPAYEVELDGVVYRQQRRETFRVSVGPLDGVQARIRAQESSDMLNATVKDISATGCRLFLETEKAYALGVSAQSSITISLTLPGCPNPMTSAMVVLRAEPFEQRLLEIGARWINPDPEFTRQVERFIVQKQRALLKRRVGG